MSDDREPKNIMNWFEGQKTYQTICQSLSALINGNDQILPHFKEDCSLRQNLMQNVGNVDGGKII